MKYATFFAAFAFAVAAIPALAADPPVAHVYALTAQNGSGETGTVALIPQGDSTVIQIQLLGAPATAQPAHIHVGPCAKLDPAPKYPLTPVRDGVSETTLKVGIANLIGGDLAVNVHKSSSEVKVYVACGDLK